MRRVSMYLAVASVALACVDAQVHSKEDRSAVDFAISDSAGVKIVANTGGDHQLGLRIQKVADLVTPDSAFTTVPWGVAADPAIGRLYAADWYGARVAVFDRTGSFVGYLGGEGDGPGELRNPSAVALDSSSSLAVWDTGRGVISRWSSKGVHLSERRAPLSYWGPGFAIRQHDLVTVTSETAGSEVVQRLVSLSSSGSKPLFELGGRLAHMELPCISIPAPKILTPSVIWTQRNDTVYVVNGPEYRIDLFDGTFLESSIRRTVKPIEVSGELALQAVESGFGPYRSFMEQCGVSPQEVVAAVGYEETLSPIQWMTIDPGGRLWVTRTSNGIHATSVDVLGPEGRYQGSFPVDGIPVAFLSDSLFVTLRLESTGVTGMALYAVAERTGDAGANLRAGLREFRDCPECPEMVELPAGSFLMGAPDGEAPASTDPKRPEWTELAEKPQFEVTIDYPFAVGKYEVTFEQWDACVEAGGCEYIPDDDGWGRGSRPVIHVARSDAATYIRWLSEITGEEYRLPTESEWEYAARAGTKTARHWGDELGTGNAVCKGCGSEWDDQSTAPVGSFPPNPFGLHDMLSNVDEWVTDCWTATHEGAPSDGSARIESSPWWDGNECERPVRRGGAWSYYPWTVRAATRNYYRPGAWTERDSRTRGFRVVRTMGP